MSFFFTKQESEKSASAKRGQKGARGVSRKAMQTAPTLNRLGCKACPLDNVGPKVHAYIPKKSVSVYFLGSHPSEFDEEKEKPFADEAGSLLRSVIPAQHKKQCAYGNIVMHHPPEDRYPDFIEIECCRSYITESIEKAKPKIIIGLGIEALNWMMKSKDMLGMRGRLFAVKVGDHSCWFMPTYHPRFILEQAYDEDNPLRNKLGHCFRADVDKAFKYLKKSPRIFTPTEAKEGVAIYSQASDFKKVLEELDYVNENIRTVALDWEAYPLRPYAEDACLISVAFSFIDKKKNERTFSLPLKHPKAEWSDSQYERIIKALSKIFKNKKITKIAHNATFEIEWMLAFVGMDCIDHENWRCTMMQAHLIDERKGPGKEEDRRPTYQNLDFLTKMYFGLGIKGLFELNKKDMRKTNLQECLLYNGVDAKFTLLLYKHQKAILKKEGLLDTFDFIKDRQTTVAIMQKLGLPVDQKTAQSFSKKLEGEIENIVKEIEGMKVVKHYKKDKGAFNPLSTDDVGDLFKNYLKRDEIIVGGKTKVDKNVLIKIDHPLSSAIIKIRNRQKLKSTNVDGFIIPTKEFPAPIYGRMIYPDGLLHTSFNTTFTTTGRLSSDDPNQQNWPKREDYWVRGQIKPKKGYTLVAIDYGQLEWCLACVCCKDKVMVEATWNDYDVHMEWTIKIAKLWPELIGGKKNLKDDKKMDKARGLVKNKMVFPVIFGATEESVGGYLNMPEKVTKSIFNEFWGTFTGLKRWQKNIMTAYYDKGYAENLFGRRRRYPMTRNEAINHPIQSTASDMVVDAMTRISKIAVETEQWHLHPHLNIHDDLTFFIPDELVYDSLDIIIPEMLKVPYDFINVPFSVDVSLSNKDWSKLEKIEKITTKDIYGDKHENHEWSQGR